MTRYIKLVTATFIGFACLFCLSFTNNSTGNSKFRTQNSKLTTDTLQYPSETHLQNVQQLTFGGDNAEAYFSFDSKWIIFQRTKANEGVLCDQIFIGKVPKEGEKFEYKMVSSGKGRTTC